MGSLGEAFLVLKDLMYFAVYMCWWKSCVCGGKSGDVLVGRKAHESLPQGVR